MPTQRSHGGAALVPINLTSPAFNGLNTADSASILGPEWATTLTNAVFDNQGRPTTRKGWVSGTTTVYDGSELLIKRIFEFYQADGTSEIISSTDDNILTGVVDLSDATASIDGTITISDGNIKFVNLNERCVAFGIGTGGIPASYSGTGTFADITVVSGSAPTGSVGTAAFGRLWGVDADGRTLRYSALLDETRWDAADGGGNLDFSRAWPEGQDTIKAVAELGGRLVVFGRKNIIILNDGSPATIGLDPTALFVEDTIPGVGAISQFAVERAAGDLWFVSDNGVTSLGREILQESTPINNVSDNVQPDIVAAISNEVDVDNITLVHSPKESFVLAIFPASEQVFMFDTDTRLQDGTHKTTMWSTQVQTAAYIRNDKSIRSSLSSNSAAAVTGEIYTYSGFSDDGASYNFVYESGWLDLGQEAAAYLKFVKKISSVIFAAANTNVIHTVMYDFGEASDTFTAEVSDAGTAAEYGISEYGSNGSRNPGDASLTAGVDVAEYGGTTLKLRFLDAPLGGGGQYVKVGLTVDTSSAEFAVQQINLFSKIGRIAH